MKHIKLVVLSLCALAFGRPAGFCTANTQAEDILALQEQLTKQEQKLTKQEAELTSLRNATAVAPPAPAQEVLGSTALLIKGAGVKVEDVDWRIAAGLSPAQAVEVAASELALSKKSKEAKK